MLGAVRHTERQTPAASEELTQLAVLIAGTPGCGVALHSGRSSKQTPRARDDRCKVSTKAPV